MLDKPKRPSQWVTKYQNNAQGRSGRVVSLPRTLARWERTIMNTMMTAPKNSVAKWVMGLASCLGWGYGAAASCMPTGI